MHISRFKNDTMDLNRSLNMNKMVWWAIKETFQVFTGFLQSWTSLSPCFLLLVDSIQKQNKKFPSSFFPSLPVHCYFNHNTQACLCGSSFHSTVKEQTKKKKKIWTFFLFLKCNCVSQQRSFSAEGCSELLSWLLLKLVLFLAPENKITTRALPVFSQPSSSLRSEQSSSPSHLHDNRTQRPVPQRNWSAVHMDVAAGDAHKHTFYSYSLRSVIRTIIMGECFF